MQNKHQTQEQVEINRILDNIVKNPISQKQCSKCESIRLTHAGLRDGMETFRCDDCGAMTSSLRISITLK